MNEIIANVIYLIHICLVLYIILGWYITPIQYLIYYIYLIILIMLSWNINGSCGLTKLESHYRNNNDEFFRPLLNKLLNSNLDKEQSDKINYFTFLFCLLLGFIKYYNKS